MKTLLALIVGLILGVGIVKGTYEYSNIRQTKEYLPCIEKATAQPGYDSNNGMSAYQQCRHLLTLTRLEAIILWQPNLWCKYDTFGCQDAD